MRMNEITYTRVGYGFRRVFVLLKQVGFTDSHNIVYCIYMQIYTLENSVPVRIQCDNGSDFISKEVDKWAYEKGAILDYSRPGKPTGNPYLEFFNGKFRYQCLSVNWFLTLEDATEKIEDWKWDYNLLRPHSSIDDLTP